MAILSTDKKLISFGTDYSAGSGISIIDHTISVIPSAVGKTYSAGPNISIYDVSGQPTISSKDWMQEIDQSSSGAVTESISYFNTWINGQYTEDISNVTNNLTALSGDLSSYYKKIETSSKAEISAALDYVSAHAVGDVEVNNYVHSNSATIDEVNSVYKSNSASYLTAVNIPESATWNETSNVVSSNSAQWNQGKTYEGVSPIIVNNYENVVSANTWTLTAGNGIALVEDSANNVTRIDCTASGDTGVNSFVTNNSASIIEVNTSYKQNSGTFLTAIPSDVATTGDVANLEQTISNTYYPKSNPSSFATESWVSSQGYLTAHQDISNKLDSSAFSSVSGDFLTTAFSIPESATWNDVSTTVQTNSSVWNDKLDVSSLDLEIGQHYDFEPGITGAYEISGASIIATNAYADSKGRAITGWYQLKDNNLLSGTKYGTLKIDNENTHLVDTTFSALSSYNGIIVSAIPYSGAGFWNDYGDYHSDSTTSHSYDNVKTYSINLQSWDGGFTAQINGTNYDHSYFDGNHTITGEFNTPSTLVVNLYRSNNYAEPTIKQFNLGVAGEINEVVDIRNVFATNEQLNTASSFLSGAIDYVSANAGGTDLVHKSDFTFVSDQWGTYLQKVSGKYIDYATRAGQAELDSNGRTITAQYFTTANANTLSSMLSGAIDYVSANAGDEFPISADEAIQYVENNSATINDVNTSYQTNSGTFLTAHQAISAEEWNDCYDNVNTNSGAWGGDALPITGRDGIDLEIDNGTLYIGASALSGAIDYVSANVGGGYNETLIFNGNISGQITDFTTNEQINNFEKVDVYYCCNDDGLSLLGGNITTYDTDVLTAQNQISLGGSYTISNGYTCFYNLYYTITNGSAFSCTQSKRYWLAPTATSGEGNVMYNPTTDVEKKKNGYIYKIIGINRK